MERVQLNGADIAHVAAVVAHRASEVADFVVDYAIARRIVEAVDVIQDRVARPQAALDGPSRGRRRE
jgi:hypothetical protein